MITAALNRKSSSIKKNLLLNFFLLNHVAVTAAGESCAVGEIVNIGPYSLADSEFAQCRTLLESSSTLSQAEYVSYLNEAFSESYSTFDLLTSSLQKAYTVSACNCLPSSVDCVCTSSDSSIDLNVTDAVLFKICGRIQYGYDVIAVPTASPLVTPSVSPPSSFPSIKPILGILPSSFPSVKPSIIATSMPSLFSGSVTLSIEYGMDTDVYLTPESILSGTNGYGIKDALISGMTSTISDVLDDLGYSSGNGSRFLRQRVRKLSVTNSGNEIESIESNGCDAAVSAATSACYIVSSTIDLEIVNKNKGTVMNNVLQALQGSLPSTFFQYVQEGSTSVVQITSDPRLLIFAPPTPAPTEAEPLNPGIYAAIALCAVTVLVGATFYYKRQRERKSKMYPGEGESNGGIGARDVNFILYGPNDKNRFSPLDDSGSEGGSGWSSNGTSPSNDNKKDFTNSLASVAVASGALSRHSENDKAARRTDENDDDASESSSQMIQEMLPITTSNNAPAVTRQDLDFAIDACDWAAVGATAALLAHQKDEYASPDRSKTARSQMSDVDQQRANELDQLVDTGDWEGIVLTAAKYESIPVSRSDESTSLDPTTFTFNTGVGSDTTGNNRKRAEIRAEVEDLVRKVVPDESGNIDEMMRQFYGREEELLETLRSMQERAIAQRQRLAMQKNAKREATTRQNKEPTPINTTEAQDKDATSTVFSDPQFDGIQAVAGGSSSGGTKSNKDVTEETETFGGVPSSIVATSTAKPSNTDEKQRLLQIEEEQALAQAEIWEKIAAANAHGAGDSKEASAAADWAIARSLQTLEGETATHTDMVDTKDPITEEDEV